MTEGTSDQALLPILKWLLHEHLPDQSYTTEFADLRLLRDPPRTLEEKVSAAAALYPSDVLFIHRDADAAGHEARVAEIKAARSSLPSADTLPYIIPVVPKRMTEAWLLFDEEATRWAADNPRGRSQLDLPSLQEAARMADPKSALQEAIRTASEATGRRLKRLRRRSSIRLVAENIEDFRPLRVLPAFNELEANVARFCRSHT